MIALVFIIVSFLASLGLIQKLFPKLSFFDQLALSWITSVIFSTWITLFFTWLVGYAVALLLCLILFAGLAYKYFAIPKKIQKIPIAFKIFLICWGVVFFFIFNRAFLPESNGEVSAVVYSYGDLALHATLINYFTGQSGLLLRSPIFAEQSIQYPFLIDFHSALLVKTGLPLHWTLVITSLLSMLSALTLLFSFCQNITKKHNTAWFATILFLFNGGLYGLAVLKDWQNSGKSFVEFFLHLTKDYTLFPDTYIQWSNVISTHLLPQRGFLFGFAFLMAFLSIWQHTWYQQKIKVLPLIFLSSLCGLLPLFHSYTFLVVTPLLMWLSGWLYHFKRISLKHAVLIIAPSLLLSVGQVVYLSSGKNFISPLVGWLSHDQDIVTFWWHNMGFALCYLLISPFIFWNIFSKKQFEKLLIIPFISIFLLCNLFIFQPYDWDNMKFFLFSYLYIAIITAAVMTHFWKAPLFKTACVLLIVVSCFSGALSVLYTMETVWTINTAKDVQIAKVIKKTNPDSIFLTASTHNHVVPMLGGRAVVLGYDGWLWSHGIDFSSVSEDVKMIFKGDPTTHALLKKYGVNYIFIGPDEEKQYSVNTQFFAKNFSTMYEDDTVKIYKVN